MDITALDKELRAGTIRPAYAVVGAEAYLAQGAMRRIQETVTKGETASSGESMRHVYDGREAKAEAVMSALRNVSLFGGGGTLVVLRDAEKLPKDTVEALTDYLASPAEGSTVVVQAEKLDGRTRFMQTMRKKGAIVECKPLYDNQIPGWINMEVRRRNLQISQEAARFLSDLVGNDLGQLIQAIERVAIYIGDRKVIDLKDIEESVAETHQHTIFELTDAVGQRKLTKAMGYLENILSGGEHPLMILRMLARHFRILIKAREVGGRMNDNAQIAKYLGVHPFYAKNYMGQSRNFSMSELKRAFRVLHRCDRELKSSRVSSLRILERAFIEIVKK